MFVRLLNLQVARWASGAATILALPSSTLIVCMAGCTTGDTMDGTIWMEWEDFTSFYDIVDVCLRSLGFEELAIHMHEDSGCAGH